MEKEKMMRREEEGRSVQDLLLVVILERFDVVKAYV